MPLPDPRNYSTNDVKNSVVLQLNSILVETNAKKRQEKQASLEFLLSQYLEQGQEEAPVVALSLVPSQKAYQHLWQTIKTLVMPIDTPQQAQIFAIPIILVAGSSRPAQLANKLTNLDKILSCLKKHQLIDEKADISLDPHLYTTETLASISLPQLYRWQSGLQYASGGLPVSLQSDLLTLEKQGIFLRYLLGVAMRTPATPSPVKLNQEIGSWGLAFSEFIQEELKQDGMTLFAIPRQPQALLDALDHGQSIYLDISLQVFLSDILKKLRLQHKTPTASISSHESNEIKIVISSVEAPEKWESFVWPLHPLDQPAVIGQNIQQLLAECQVHDVLLSPIIQADNTVFLPSSDKLHQQTNVQPH